jgi:hypothetical protein
MESLNYLEFFFKLYFKQFGQIALENLLLDTKNLFAEQLVEE